MSLDKWIKSSKKKEKTKEEHVSKKNETKLIKETNEHAKKIIKYALICPKKNCAYQKILIKKQLTEKDKVCPRCKSSMNVKIKK